MVNNLSTFIEFFEKKISDPKQINNANKGKKNELFDSCKSKASGTEMALRKQSTMTLHDWQEHLNASDSDSDERRDKDQIDY